MDCINIQATCCYEIHSSSISRWFCGSAIQYRHTIDITPSTSTDSKNFTKHIGTYEPVDNNHLQRFDIEQAYINTGRQGSAGNSVGGAIIIQAGNCVSVCFNCAGGFGIVQGLVDPCSFTMIRYAL